MPKGKLLSIVFIETLFVFLIDLFWIFVNPRNLMIYAVVFFIIYIILAHLYQAFDVQSCKIKELVISHDLAILIASICTYMISCIMELKLLSFIPIVTFILSCFIISRICVPLARRSYLVTHKPKKSAIVYSQNRNLTKKIIKSSVKSQYNIKAKINENSLSDIISKNVLKNYDTIFAYEISETSKNQLLKFCISNNIEFILIPDVNDIIISSAENQTIAHLTMKKIQKTSPKKYYLFFKRAFDIIASLLALIILSPVFLITAIAIKCDDAGPVFYKQTRLTKDDKEFKIIKFRSMKTDAEKNGIRLSSGSNDDRVTKVGHFIRKVRIDEIPQLLNILKGDMSIVGPRPERPEIAEEYYKELPEFKLRLQVKAGLTGYAQVYGQYNTTAYDKLLFDLIYISHPSLINDLKIIFLTIKTIFMEDSTEGIAVEQATAGVRASAE